MQALELRIPPVVQVIVITAFMWILSSALPNLSFVLDSAPLVAMVVAAAGVIFSVLGVLKFRSAGTTVDPRVPSHSASLVTGGVYRISRNPMYVGFLLVLVAWGILLGNFASFVLLPIFVVCMNRFQIRPEERHMREKFGEAYSRYQAQVRRWI